MPAFGFNDGTFMETPVLVGAAQLEQRIQAPEEGKEPIELMIDACRMAAEDAGCPALLAQANSVRVIRGWWRYQNPAKALCEAFGNIRAQTAITPFGGNMVQSVVNRSALEIQSGEHEVIVITGAECGHSQARARRTGTKLKWRDLDGTPDLQIGEDTPMSHPRELALNIVRPTHMYPIMELARRHHLGEGVAQHLRRISELWADFSAVAAENPHAWLRTARSAEEIRTPSPANRPVSFPYAKLMNSNNKVDQAAALIMCSERRAAALGADRAKWVYPWTGTDAHDHCFVSNRDNLYSSPAIRIAGGRALELAGLAPKELDMVDLYSCFPIAVQVAAAELGLSPTQRLSVTGGLTFAGGPLNSYVMHSIARMVELLRTAPGKKGLISANGGFLTKHAFGIYSAAPPKQPFQYAAPQAEVDALPFRELAEDYRGGATVEGYAVIYNGEGPHTAHIAARLDGGERAWANCRDADVLEAMTREEFCGRRLHLDGDHARFMA